MDEETKQKFIDAMRQKTEMQGMGTCPNCGYCPHCGRGHQMAPSYPYQPIWIAPQYPGYLPSYPGQPWNSPWITYTSGNTCVSMLTS